MVRWSARGLARSSVPETHIADVIAADCAQLGAQAGQQASVAQHDMARQGLPFGSNCIGGQGRFMDCQGAAFRRSRPRFSPARREQG